MRQVSGFCVYTFVWSRVGQYDFVYFVGECMGERTTEIVCLTVIPTFSCYAAITRCCHLRPRVHQTFQLIFAVDVAKETQVACAKAGHEAGQVHRVGRSNPR